MLFPYTEVLSAAPQVGFVVCFRALCLEVDNIRRYFRCKPGLYYRIWKISLVELLRAWLSQGKLVTEEAPKDYAVSILQREQTC